VDLFEPGSGSQVHDFNGGILASGLFWTLAVGNDDLRISEGGNNAVLDVEDIQVVDSFQFGSAIGTPATVSLHVEWTATGPKVERGKGSSVLATDPAAFLGKLAVAESTAELRGSELGFSFSSDPGVSTADTFAEMGRERNGVFL
jgi:hypothetical protein